MTGNNTTEVVSESGCPVESRVGMNVVYTSLCLLGTVTNILNLMVLRNRHFPVISSSFTFMTGLAVFDLITCFCSIPMGLQPCNLFSEEMIWTFRFYLCYFYYPVVRAIGACSVFTTLAMSLDRIVQLKWPTAFMGTKPTRKAVVVMCCLYVALQTIHIPFFFGYKIKSNGHIVKTEWRLSKQFPIFMWISIVVVKIVPIVLVIMVNIWLTKLVIQISHKREKLIDRKGGKPKKERSDSSGQMRVTFMLLTVAVIYLFCQILEPFSHHIIFEAIFGKDSDQTRGYSIFRIVIMVLEMLSYSTNFFPYVICNLVFRRVLLVNVLKVKSNQIGPMSTYEATATVSNLKS